MQNFFASSVDPSAVKFGPNETSVRNNLVPLRDVNGDGRLDLVLSVNTQETGGCIMQCHVNVPQRPDISRREDFRF